MTTKTRKSTRQALEQHASWKPAKWELPDAYAIQALWRGDASKDMQQRALKWIMETVCCTYDLSYRPGDSSRDTDFAEGKRYVGLQIRKMIVMNLSELRRRENERPHDPTGSNP